MAVTRRKVSRPQVQESVGPSVIDQPLISFGREICGDVEAGLRREWLVTNGLGGYASGTVSGIPTRSYHGLLVAALDPPAERTVLVGGMIEWATYDGARFPLSAFEYGDGTLDPQGYRHIQSFSLEGTVPVWVFVQADAWLERRVWMRRGTNTTYVMYSLLRATAPVDLEITPLVTYRSFHALSSGRGWQIGVEEISQGARIQAYDGAVPFYLRAEGGQFAPGGAWWWNLRYRAEAARGLNAQGDLYAPGTFRTTLRPGMILTLELTTEAIARPDGPLALVDEKDRQAKLLRQANASAAHPVVQQLTLAADQFVVARGLEPGAIKAGRTDAAGAQGKTIIAGYHWFGDWGRDTMISLSGLTLATGRTEDAAGILRTFARYVRDGLLPNNFPDKSGMDPGYNTADASLWYFLAVRAYHLATDDTALVDAFLPVLRDIVDHHIKGTHYNIGVDPDDGLLRAGEPGVQLTWMDAKIGDWVITPRIGKPVEINALWYNALRTLAEFLDARDDPTAQAYGLLAERARTSFRDRFMRADLSYLADVLDGPQGDDWSLRPNQIFAVSLPYPLLDGSAARSVVDAVGRSLLTSYGLRSLAPVDPAYHGSYGGDTLHRDNAYHQGPVWTWLMGPYVEAYYRVYQDASAALQLLSPFQDHLRDAGLGSISEILEGDPPHFPRGCIAQAWGVAEVLRVWRDLELLNVQAQARVGTPSTT
ncbi:MAG: putative glycogen debranching enzyme [Chloroflexi bacterium]|nr:putative glycogen debranching enzyme [Chloroflexota bacterium]